MSRLIVSLSVVAIGLLIGCEQQMDYASLGLVQVSGKVTMDGAPLPGVTVRFEGPPNRFADGRTDANGKYVLSYDSNQTGCLPGEKIVRIMAGGAGEGFEEEGPVEGADGKVVKQVGAIPPSYNQQSTLTANVTPEKTTFDFELKSSP